MFGNHGAVVLGELDGGITPRLTALHKMLATAFNPEAIMTEEIFGYLWGKLGYGALLTAEALTSAHRSRVPGFGPGSLPA